MKCENFIAFFNPEGDDLTFIANLGERGKLTDWILLSSKIKPSYSCHLATVRVITQLKLQRSIFLEELPTEIHPKHSE